MSKRLTTQQFIEKSKLKHGDKYDYSMVEYITAKIKVEIICSYHGPFWQLSNNHLQGADCKKCGYQVRSKSITKTTKQFIEKSVKRHGYKYDYSKAKYINSNKKIEIICPQHGCFWQVVGSHIHGGAGCPKCAPTSDYDVLYIWQVIGELWNDKPIYKIGVTSEHLGEKRIKKVARSINAEYKVCSYIKTEDALDIETELHNNFTDIPNMGDIDGRTEFRAIKENEMLDEIEWLDVLYD